MTDRNTPSPEKLIAELRTPAQWCCIFEHEGAMRHGVTSAPFKAADHLESLLADRAKLEEALEPLALLAGDTNMNDPLRKWFTVGQLYAARDALNRSADRG